MSKIRREKARRKLAWFTQYTYPQYCCEAAHEYIAGVLDRVVRGDIRRLMIFAPPQSGKSELASVRLPAFWFGHCPDDPVILTSYGASLAHGKSWQARGIVEGADYGDIFPDVRVDPTQRAREDWRIAGHRGEMIAAGVGGPITGHGAMLGIVDDPFENWQEAYSETTREAVWTWYRTTFRTRIWEGGRIVIIMTRWHEDDLCGRLLKDQGEQWTVLRLPALGETQEERDENNRRLGLPEGQPDPLGREAGEPLTPTRFSKEALLELKEDVGIAAWFAQYQGTPRAPQGNAFQRGWFEIVRAVPGELARVVRYWDKAATQGGGCYTCGVLMGRVNGTYYVMDVVRGQWETGERERIMRNTALVDNQRFGHVTQYFEQEPGSSGVDSARATVRNMAGLTVRAERATGSKEIRAEPFAVQAEAGNVKLLEGDWNWRYLEELAGFPNAAINDQVDGSSGAFNKVVAVGELLY